MNRPAVRNVRALRTERDLVRARRAHAQARERRRAAASHRSVVACALVGVLLGVGVVAALTVLPWWPALVPAALLVASMAAGRRAVLAGQQAERRERRRIAELEAELERLTGQCPTQVAASLVPQKAAQTEEAAQTAPLEAAHDPAATAARQEVAASGTARGEVTKEAVATRPTASAEVREPGTVAVQEREKAAPAAQTSVSTAPKAARLVREASTQTPPQGWQPVQVPAPTYTLVATAPRRRVEDLEETAAPSAPVPMRPKAVRSLAAREVGEEPRQPIDLDAVLQRRRAAGA